MYLNGTLFVQIAVFLALWWFTATYVWPPITQALDQRAKKIADGLAAAEKGRQDLMSAESKSKDIERQARERANDIVAAAEKRGAVIVEDAKTTARAEGDRLVAAAHAEVGQETQRAKDALRKQVAGLAVAGAERILRREVDPKAHTDMLAQLEREL